MMRSQTKRIAFCALMIASGAIIGYIESTLTAFIRIPGIRIGLANIATVLTLYLFGPCDAFAVLVLRVSLLSLLFGSPVSFTYSIAGALVSFGVMLLLKKLDFSIYGVSAGAAVAHNITQTGVAAYFVSSPYVFTYMPILAIAGVTAGLMTGSLASLLVRRFESIKYNGI